MNRLLNNLRLPLRIALLMLLLSMQSVVLAHELGQSTVHDGGVCAVCSIGNGHDGVLPSQHACPLQAFTPLQPAQGPEAQPFEPAHHTPEARAPPSSL